MATASATRSNRHSTRWFCLILACLTLPALALSGCALPQTPGATSPPTAIQPAPLTATQAPKAVVPPTVTQPAPAQPAGASPTSPPAAVIPSPEPPTPTAPAAPSVEPSVTATIPPPAGAPRPPCGSGPPPSSLSGYPEPEPLIVYGNTPYVQVGRFLSVTSGGDVDYYQEGADYGSDLYEVRSESCTVNGELEYDIVYVVYYAPSCPTSIADIPENASGPWGVCFVGRTLCIDGNCQSEGSTSATPEQESWSCMNHDYVYTVYWSEEPSCVPEPSTLLLVTTGLTSLGGWVAWQRRRRKQQ